MCSRRVLVLKMGSGGRELAGMGNVAGRWEAAGGVSRGVSRDGPSTISRQLAGYHPCLNGSLSTGGAPGALAPDPKLLKDQIVELFKFSMRDLSFWGSCKRCLFFFCILLPRLPLAFGPAACR